jgi:hypothetical protein
MAASRFTGDSFSEIHHFSAYHALREPGESVPHMITRALNLFLAIISTLVIVVDMAKGNGPTDLRSAFFVAITLCWLAGAVGLLSRKRWAWYASLLGVGSIVLDGIGKIVISLTYAQDPTDGNGFAAALITLCLLFIWIPVLIGVFRLRQWVSSGRNVAETSAPPNGGTLAQ